MRDGNLFDLAYDFERIFRNSEEYTRLKRLFKEVNTDPTAMQLFNKYNHLQSELLNKQMMGQKVMKQEIDDFQKTLAHVQQNEKIVKLLEADQHVNILITKLNKIITKPLEEIYGTPEGR
jgi:cell fate (sporulation/competence/biofilm development) regulator YlbF (YheA/YmcA/DUF963 family)